MRIVTKTDPAAVVARGHELLAGRVPEVDAALSRWLPLATEAPVPVHEAMRYATLGPGKRFRPVLLLLVGETLGVESEAALPSACALEFIHAFSLVHDDLPAMDDDDLRRGRPTCHRAYGEATAILAGDALCALAFEVIARGTPAADLVPDLVATLGDAVGTRGMIGGQVLDLLGEGAAPTLEAVGEIHRRKTAALIRAACVMGAILGRAEPPAREALTRYGEACGLAFQVADDVLDATATTETLGKAAGRDLELGKLTWPACVGLDESVRTVDRLAEQAAAAVAGLDRDGHLALLARFIAARAT